MNIVGFITIIFPQIWKLCGSPDKDWAGICRETQVKFNRFNWTWYGGMLRSIIFKEICFWKSDSLDSDSAMSARWCVGSTPPDVMIQQSSSEQDMLVFWSVEISILVLRLALLTWHLAANAFEVSCELPKIRSLPMVYTLASLCLSLIQKTGIELILLTACFGKRWNRQFHKQALELRMSVCHS